MFIQGLVRIHRKRMLCAALLTLSLLASVTLGSARPAAAQAVPGVMVELSFNSITFQNTNDGEDSDLEVYASLVGEAFGGGGGVRNLGTWASDPGWCPTASWWSAAVYGPCPKDVNPGAYAFASTAMCKSSTYQWCEGPYQYNNNKIRFMVTPGQLIRASIHMKDYDSSSADDEVCHVQKFVGPFTAAQLSTLNQSFGMGQFFNGSASCTVQWSVRRV
jgi:hypothetical protein